MGRDWETGFCSCYIKSDLAQYKFSFPLMLVGIIILDQMSNDPTIYFVISVDNINIFPRTGPNFLREKVVICKHKSDGIYGISSINDSSLLNNSRLKAAIL